MSPSEQLVLYIYIYIYWLRQINSITEKCYENDLLQWQADILKLSKPLKWREVN